MRKTLFVICLSIVAALVAAGPASAGGPYANIKVTATCSVTNGVLDVNVGWFYADPLNPGPAPKFSHETLILQKHVQSTQFSDVATLLNKDFIPMVAEPEDFSGDICGYKDSFNGANALRVEAQLTVANANPKRPDGLVFKARCVSFPPPACHTP